MWIVISKATVHSDIYDATEKSSLTSITVSLSVSAWLSTAPCDPHLTRQLCPLQWQAAQFVVNTRESRAQLTLPLVAASCSLTWFVADGL